MKTFEEFREGISRPSFPKWMLGVTDGDYGLDDTIHTTAKHYLISTSKGVLGKDATPDVEKKNLTSYLNDLYKRFKGIDSTPRKKDVEKALKDTIMYMQQLRQKNESINESVITKKNGEFLSFLAQDMTRNPQRIQLMNSELIARVESLVDGVEIDLDAPLSEEDDGDYGTL